MLRGSYAKILAVGVGGGLLFTVVPLLAVFVRNEWMSYSLTALAYAAVAGIVGYAWPQLSWRTGLWFFASFPLVMIVSFFFAGPEVPINWQVELRNLLGYTFVLAAACFGGWFGATLSRRRTTATTAQSSGAS